MTKQQFGDTVQTGPGLELKQQQSSSIELAEITIRS